MAQLWYDPANTMPNVTQVLFRSYQGKQPFLTGSLHVATPWWQKDFSSMNMAQPRWLALEEQICPLMVDAVVKFKH